MKGGNKKNKSSIYYYCSSKTKLAQKDAFCFSFPYFPLASQMEVKTHQPQSEV